MDLWGKTFLLGIQINLATKNTKIDGKCTFLKSIIVDIIIWLNPKTLEP